MKKYLLSAVLMLVMTGFAMAQTPRHMHHSGHHHHHHAHHKTMHHR